MLNLSKSELRLIAKKGSVSGYKNMSKDELISAINISKPAKNIKNNIFKLKREEIKKSLMKPSKKKIFKSKIKKIKGSLMKPSKKKIFKSKIKEIKDILYDLILDRDEKIEEIEKFFMIQKIIFLNQKKIIISQ